MKREELRGAIALVAVIAASSLIATCSDSDGGSVEPPPPAALTATQKAALDEALQDAYKTYYTYDVVVSEISSATPFTTILADELAQATALSALYGTHGATAPQSQWNAANVERFANREQACLAAEEGEVASNMLYERLMSMQLPSDIRNTFSTIRERAMLQHRVAFRNCIGGTPAALNPDLQAAITEALQDGYRAFHTYSRVLTDFGTVTPFSTIKDAEWQQVGAVANLLVKRGISVPASNWNGDNVARYASLADACTAAVDGEIASALMYNRLLLQSLPTDVERVFENMRSAAIERHMPAFEKCGTKVGTPVNGDVLAAMDEAIQDEYRAHFTYKGVVEDIEPDFPFGPISDAEESHYSALANLYSKRGLPVPASTWSLSNVPRYGTLQAACAASVQGEIENIAIYDRLLLLALPDDVKRVFGNLRAASNDQHLPKFQSCD